MIETLYVAGDTAPLLTGQFTSDGVALDLTGATVNLRMKRPDDAMLVRAATITDAPTGAWSYAWQPGELIAGPWLVDIEVSRGGTVQTSPSTRPLVFEVRGRLAGPDGSVEVPPVLGIDAVTGLQDALDGLSSTYGTRKVALEEFARKVRAGESFAVAIASDSTSDESPEWFCRTWDDWAAKHPGHTLTYKAWNDGTQSYDTTTRQAGSGLSARPVMDRFNRTAAELIGSTAPRGASAWEGASGSWSTNGTDAVWAASTGFQVLPGGATSTSKKASGSVVMNTTAGASLKRINLGMSRAGTNIERFSIQVEVTTGGAITWGVDGQFPGWSLVLGNDAPTNVTSGAAIEIAWSLAVAGNAVTATVNGQVRTGTLTAPQQAAVDLMDSAFVQPEGPLTGMKLHDIALDVTDTTAGPTLTVVNGSRAGSDLTYQQTRMAAMFGTAAVGPIDALFVSASHNYGATTPAAYLAAMDSFLAAYGAAQTSGVVLVAQNPEAPPASNRAAHRSRIAALDKHARDNGYGHLDALAAFEAYTGWAGVLVRPDGVHPTAATAYDDAADPDNGDYVWKQAALAWLDRLTA